MEKDSLEIIESKLAKLPLPSVPFELRQAVLSHVHRELATARWDRRFGRATIMLLVLGVGMNASVGLPWPPPATRQQNQLVHDRSRESLVETAVNVAEATDASTASRFARHLAEVAGWTLTDDELLTIDAAIQRKSVHAISNRGKG